MLRQTSGFREQLAPRRRACVAKAFRPHNVSGHPLLLDIPQSVTSAPEVMGDGGGIIIFVWPAPRGHGYDYYLATERPLGVASGG